MPDDHPVTRATIEEAGELVNALARSLERPVRVVDGDHTVSVFRRRTGTELSVAKSARMVSGLGGAMALADAGFLPESACLLRVTTDLVVEVLSTTEGLRSGNLTGEQRAFVEHFFARPIEAPEPGSPRLPYPSRAAIFKAMDRLVGGANRDRDEFKRMKESLDYSLDAYVHGTYATCMELWDPFTERFMLQGVKSQRDRAEMRGYIASITHQVLIAIGMTALAMRNGKVNKRVQLALDRLANANEEVYSHEG